LAGSACSRRGGFFPASKKRACGQNGACLRRVKSENRLKKDLIEAEKTPFTTFGTHISK